MIKKLFINYLSFSKPHCHFGFSPFLYAMKIKRTVKKIRGSPNTKKLLPESGFPGMDSSLLIIRMVIITTYESVRSQPCQVTGVQPQPQIFRLNQ